MIQKLRKEFILVAMCSTLVVLTVIIGAANAVNYMRVIEKGDKLLQILAENNAVFPKDSFHFKIGGAKSTRKIQEGMSPETPYETRFFSVSLDDEGEILSTDTGNVAAVGSSDAADIAKKVAESGKVRGFVEEYRYEIFDEDGDKRVIFVDLRREMDAFREFAAASAGISAAGMLAVFVLVVVFSKKVFRPVAESYERQKRFITDASHELKTPLAVISANVDVLEMEGEENHWTDSIRRQTERLTALTEQMVDLSRMDEGSTQNTMVDFSISDAVTETLQPFQVLAENQGKLLQMRIAVSLTYHGDEKRIRQMVSLLTDNAVKYASEGSAIEVVLAKQAKHCVFSVQNAAEGLPKGDLGVLFERFYRLDTSRSQQTGGAGIGLSIVKAIVEMHGGSITAKSKDGKTFVVTAIL